MNADKIMALAGYIERSTDRPFHMQDHHNCVGAYAKLLWPSGIDENMEDVIGREFEIGPRMAESVCYYCLDKSGEVMDYDDIPRVRAVAALRRYAQTGELYF